MMKSQLLRPVVQLDLENFDFRYVYIFSDTRNFLSGMSSSRNVMKDNKDICVDTRAVCTSDMTSIVS